jgi:SAM-dependent methyltransferase
MKADDFKRMVLPYVRNSLLNPLFISRNATRRFLRQSSDFIGGRVLDVGCGEKEFLEVIQRRASGYVGLEYPASRETQGVPLRPPEVFGSAAALPFRDEGFDTVLCICVLEHVPNPLEVLMECRRVAKPGGHILVAVPLSDRIHCPPYDFYRYTPHGLRHLARAAGLDECRIFGLTGTFANVGIKLSSYVLNNWIFTKAETYAQRKVRFWALPFGVVSCFLIQCLFLLLDKIHCDTQDAEQYFLIASRPAEPAQ